MSKLNTPNPSSVSKLNPKSQFLGSGIFDKKGITTALLLTALNGCGGGGSAPSSPVTPGVIGGTQPTATPLSSIPIQATGMIELGPISGGSVSFATASGGTLGSYTTGSDGSISYNPRDIVSRMGNASYIIVNVSGGQDTDADDDGVRDTTPTPIVGSFRMIVLRSSLERGDRIVVNPRAGAVSETLLGRSNPSITLASLDHIARETGADDQNNDGVINYRDLMSIQMKSVTGVSGIVPAVSGYIASVHSGDTSAKQRALKNIAKTENHILLSIVPHSNTSDHTPMVRLESISGGNILYTLDGSSPIPGGSTTRTGVSGMVIAMQGAKLYYREQFVLGGETVLGKVAGFDLTSDWTELAQISVPYNSSGAPSTMTDTYSYKNIPYTITTLSNNISPGYTYPKTIDCRVGTTAGCHLGPYMAWTPEHEARVRSMIATGVQNHIDTPGVVIPVTPIVPVTPVVPTPPSLQHTQNQSVSYTTRVNNYYGGFYEVFNTYNLNGTSDFPVQISGIYGVRNQSTQTPAILMAANETERVQKSNQMVANIQSLIQAGYNNTPAPSYPQNSIIDSGAISYRGYSYRVLTTMNLSGTSDYPASVRVSYTTPLSGNNTTLTIQANSATELTSVQADRANDARARIDLILDNDLHAPNQEETITNTTSYGGGSYKTLFTYSGNPGQDYPGYVDVYITYRNGLSDRLTITVENANQKSTYAANLETQAKMQIDNYNTTYPINFIGTDGPYPYGNKGSEYAYKVKYNRVGTSANYPALVWIEYRSRSTGQVLDTRTTYGNLTANTSVEKEQIKATLLQFVQGQMVALGGVGGAQLATAWKFENILPMSVAHAATPSTFVVKNNYASVPNFSYLSPNTMAGKFLAYNGNVLDHIVGNRPGKSAVAGGDIENISLKQTIAAIQNSAEQIRMIQSQCSGVGTTLSPIGSSSGCILTPAQQTRINTYEKDIFQKIGEYLQFGGGLSVGAGTAIYDEIMGIGSDVVELADGTTLQAFENNLGALKAKLSAYIVNGQIDYSKIKNSLITGTSAIEQEISVLINELPGAINSLDVYSKGYYTGMISGGIVLEFVNPTKKLRLITRGFSAGKWASTARYIIDSAKAGHSGAKMKEIAEKMRNIPWSRVNKPDMSKISHPDLIEQINLNYKITSVIGNGSTADAIRYTKVTGLLVGDLKPSDHLIKGQNTLNALKKRFNANDLTSIEKPIAQGLYNDVQEAINGN